jgi:hypothetical protein
MIRFICQHCGKSVRVADSFAGRGGRCPSCNCIVQIPAKSQPDAGGQPDLAALQAALEKDLPIATAKEVEPTQLEPRLEDMEVDFDGDGSNKTDAMPAINAPLSEQTRSHSKSAPDVYTERPGLPLWLIAGIVLVILIMLAAVYVFYRG